MTIRSAHKYTLKKVRKLLSQQCTCIKTKKINRCSRSLLRHLSKIFFRALAKLDPRLFLLPGGTRREVLAGRRIFQAYHYVGMLSRMHGIQLHLHATVPS